MHPTAAAWLATVGLALAFGVLAPTAIGASGHKPSTGLILGAVRSKAAKTQTCQVQNRSRKGAPSTRTMIGNARAYPVVACEQPPRSELLTPSTLKQVVTNAIVTIG